MQTIGYGLAADVSWGFTGTLLGIYATSNGGEGLRLLTSRNGPTWGKDNARTEKTPVQIEFFWVR
ncbi:uncharacterized protein B0H18DRAFT_1114496 [Fomitopsis serialis]|uniref:uncharacterized protein n=1 Tax=Fomitopsis serialis TaxID=139415 RepID=UPI002008852B|nr:uncharacterized protein B0H18DRAFT_1114496 [Neoantrodia serialis]KAH9935800.1 hypothetical protein B0H18DRAFT_1114496 [Neoantrodia serialis]